ncbi:MAG: hypothetical protein FJY07_13170 [Bacteroidetes bacterium]|nr:hypothetical protein [Bacteroidota bacterium]
MVDRYTILKWKEAWSNLTSNFSGTISGLYASCNATPAARLVTLGLIVVIVLLVYGGIFLLCPEPSIPMTKKLVLTAIDAQKDTWAMDYLKNQDIEAILSGPVKPGQPLTLTVKFLQKSPNLLILPEITGTAGERYFPGILKNGQWQKAPRFTLTNQNGKLLHQGQFAYG